MVAVRLSDKENCHISSLQKSTFLILILTSLKSGILMVCYSLIERVFCLFLGVSQNKDYLKNNGIIDLI